MWPALKRALLVMWDNITATFFCQSPVFQLTVQLSDADTYLFSETATNFTITPSHPVRVGGVVEVMVNRTRSGEGCTASLNGNVVNTNIALLLPSSPQLLGTSINVTCKK